MEETPKSSGFVQDILAELSRDKKKAVLVGVLSVVALVMVGRVLLNWQKSPRPAAAAMLSVPVKPVVDDEAAKAARDQTLKSQAKRNQYLQQMDGSITRDLFHANLESYPLKAKTQTVRLAPPPPVATAPAVDEQAVLRESVRAEAKALVLESTMLGETSIASINGRICRVGESVNGFEIIEITAQNCSVRKSGIKVVLTINAK